MRLEHSFFFEHKKELIEKAFKRNSTSLGRTKVFDNYFQEKKNHINVSLDRLTLLWV